MAIQILNDELKFEDIQNLWQKAKNLGAKIISKYFNFEVVPDTDIVIESILIQEGYALITAVFTKIPLRFQITLYQKAVKVQFLTADIIFEEKVEEVNQ